MQKIRNWFYRFMSGRYGNDGLNMALLAGGVVLALIANLVPVSYSLVPLILSWACWLYYTFRAFSRNIAARQAELYRFNGMIRPLRRRINLAKKARADKTHKYFLCPKCGKMLRVPKGRGKIVVTCPGCAGQFERRS